MLGKANSLTDAIDALEPAVVNLAQRLGPDGIEAIRRARERGVQWPAIVAAIEAQTGYRPADSSVRRMLAR